MLIAETPFGLKVRVPETPDEDAPYPSVDRPSEVAAAYERDGYVVLRGLVPPTLCDAVRAAFDGEVRRSGAPILRQKNMRYEANAFDADGFLSNPIFNVQDLETRRFGRFKRAALDVLTHPAVAAATGSVLGVPRTKLIQSMFFEAPAGTWAHQDSYYQDSADGLGGGVAGWFALEDVDAGAGRFYVASRSHVALPPLRNEGEFGVALGHDRYKRAVVEAVRSAGLDCSAPHLRKGDVLLWSSLLVHGSLEALRPGVSRASLTAHYLAESAEMLQFHARVRKLDMTRHNGMAVGLLHNQDRLRNRVVRQVAWRAPGLFGVARRAAIQAVLAANRLRGAAAAAPAAAASAVPGHGASRPAGQSG